MTRTRHQRTFPTLSMHNHSPGNHTSRHFVKMGDFKCVLKYLNILNVILNILRKNVTFRLETRALDLFLLSRIVLVAQESTCMAVLKPPGKE